MIDVHSHIVFDVDDGPKTLERKSWTSLAKAMRKGGSVIVSTSHVVRECLKPPEDKIFANFSKVKAEAEANFIQT